jgi:hypothetical protein
MVTKKSTTTDTNVARVVGVSSSIHGPCEVCGEPLGFKDEGIAAKINHYLEHGYRLLHVGSDTSHADNGELWHSTVAILGH